MAETVLRLGVDGSVSDFRNDSPYAKDFDYRTLFGIRVGVEWKDFPMVLDFFLRDTAGSEDALGSERFLVGAGCGYQLPLFWQLFFEPFAEVGVGGGKYDSGEGLAPEAGFDWVVRGGALLAVDFPLGRVDAEIGPAIGYSHSFLQDYWGLDVGGMLTFRLGSPHTPIVQDDCEENLRRERNFLAKCEWDLHPTHDQIIHLQGEASQLEEAIDAVSSHQKKLYETLESWCKPAPLALEEEVLWTPVDAIPPWYWEGLTCEEESKEVEQAQKLACVTLPEKYEKKLGSLGDIVAQLDDRFQKLLNWSVSCTPLVRPPRFLLFTNDNPDIALQPQWREEIEDGKLKIYSNPVLDEILLYLARNPNVKLGFITLANETGTEEGDHILAEGRKESIHQYLTLIGAGGECQRDRLGPCPYQYQKKGVSNSNILIGGAYVSKRELPGVKETYRFVLPKERICFAQPYSREDLKKNLNVKDEVRMALPPATWLGTTTSPFYRIAVFTFIEDGKCP